VAVKVRRKVVYIQKKEERAKNTPWGTPLTREEYSELTPFKVTCGL